MSMQPTPDVPGTWRDGDLKSNIHLGRNTILTGGRAFHRFYATHEHALRIGENGTFDGVTFAVGKAGTMTIGNWCHFCGAVLLCESEVHIGSYVSLAWNVTIADTDFHPIDPQIRLQDVIACSNLSKGPRPPIPCKPVYIEDDVYVGPNATILKGVRIGAGSWIEPGSLVTKDVPPRSRVMGNPARVIGEVV